MHEFCTLRAPWMFMAMMGSKMIFPRKFILSVLREFLPHEERIFFTQMAWYLNLTDLKIKLHSVSQASYKYYEIAPCVLGYESRPSVLLHRVTCCYTHFCGPWGTMLALASGEVSSLLISVSLVKVALYLMRIILKIAEIPAPNRCSWTSDVETDS